MKTWQRSDPMGTMGVVGSPNQGNMGSPRVIPTLPAQASPTAVAAVGGVQAPRPVGGRIQV